MAYRDDKVLELRIAFGGLTGAGKSACVEAIARELSGPPIKRTMSGSLETALRTLPKVRGLDTSVLVESMRRESFGSIQRENALGDLDALLWVVDSRGDDLDANREALDELRAALVEMGRDPALLPLHVLWNKRDLPEAKPTAELAEALGVAALPQHETVASERRGVIEAFRAAVRSVLRREKLA